MYMFTSPSTETEVTGSSFLVFFAERAQEPGPSDYEYISPWTLLKLENCRKVRSQDRWVFGRQYCIILDVKEEMKYI